MVKRAGRKTEAATLVAAASPLPNPTVSRLAATKGAIVTMGHGDAKGAPCAKTRELRLGLVRQGRRRSCIELYFPIVFKYDNHTWAVPFVAPLDEPLAG